MSSPPRISRNVLAGSELIVSRLHDFGNALARHDSVDRHRSHVRAYIIHPPPHVRIDRQKPCREEYFPVTWCGYVHFFEPKVRQFRSTMWPSGEDDLLSLTMTH